MPADFFYRAAQLNQHQAHARTCFGRADQCQIIADLHQQHFTLLALQGLSELIKRIAFLQGLIADPNAKEGAPSAEQELAAEIAAMAKEKK